ncbi:hypothetical protein ACNOYE_18795 [Nannocystaceae bacterium ST9]
MLGLSLGVVAMIALACVANTGGTGNGTGKETEGCIDGLFCEGELVCVIGYCLADHDDTETGGDSIGDLPLECGNGQIDEGEDCDGAELAGASCTSLGWDQGALGCTASCSFEFSDCSNDPQPGLGELYSHCTDNAGCPGLDGCLTMVDDMQVVVDGFCTNFCTLDAECLAPTGGSALPVCRMGLQSVYCALDCSEGRTCPGGMTCSVLESGGELCF